MVVYTNIEERFCFQCNQNVGIESIHMDDGSVVKRCLSKTCGKSPDENNCFFNRLE